MGGIVCVSSDIPICLRVFMCVSINRDATYRLEKCVLSPLTGCVEYCMDPVALAVKGCRYVPCNIHSAQPVQDRQHAP